MANYEINEEQEVLTKAMRMIETGDPVHADVYNVLFSALLNNDVFLEKLANKMVQQAMISHVMDSTNSNMVLGADQGPVITKLIDKVQEQVTVLNTKTKLSKGEVLNFRYIGAALLGSTSILYFTMYIKKFATLPTVKLNGTCVIQYENIVLTLDVSKITAVIIDSNGSLGQVMISMDISSETIVKNIPVGVDISLTITGN